MAAFLLSIHAVSVAWPFSFDQIPGFSSYSGNGFRLTVARDLWNSGDLFTFPDGVAWLDGQLLVQPQKAAAFDEWLAEADGSFRGVFFPNNRDEAVLVADPYGSRPVYYSALERAPAASDKLVSLPQCDEQLRHVRPEVFLEALTLGCVTSYDTSLEHVRQVPAGCTVTLRSGEQKYAGNPADGPDANKREHPGSDCRPEASRTAEVTRYRPPPNQPAGTSRQRSLWRDICDLRDAVNTAISDTWTEPSAPLLLSGGYDSRWILHAKGKGRRAVTTTVDPARNEAQIARRVARACGAEYETAIMGTQDWLTAMTQSHPVSAGMYTPMSATFTRQAKNWAENGTHTLAHGFLFDTLMKGYFCFVPGEHPHAVSDWIPGRLFPAADAEMGERYLRDLFEHLTPEAKKQLSSRLAQKEAAISWQQVGQHEFGFEYTILGAISRQPHSLLSLSMLEHVELQSPVFHSAIWEWWRQSNPANRRPALAYIGAFLLDCGRCAWIRKDTGDLAAKTFLRSFAAQRLAFIRKRKHRTRTKGKPQRGTPPTTKKSASSGTARGLELVREAMKTECFQNYCHTNLPVLKEVSLLDPAFVDRLLTKPATEWGVHDKLPCFLASIGAFCTDVLAPRTPKPEGGAQVDEQNIFEAARQADD